jgi:uncharacterized protein (TIGR00369 family)
MKMNIDELEAFLEQMFPGARRKFSVNSVETKGRLSVSYRVKEKDLRPGGTVAGPVMMLIADTASMLALLSEVGPEAMAVTSNLNIHFLSKPSLQDIITHTEILKIGKRSAVIDVRLQNPGSSQVLAQATVSYSRPPKN